VFVEYQYIIIKHQAMDDHY